MSPSGPRLAATRRDARALHLRGDLVDDPVRTTTALASPLLRAPLEPAKPHAERGTPDDHDARLRCELSDAAVRRPEAVQTLHAQARLLPEENARLTSGSDPSCARELAEIAIALRSSALDPTDLADEAYHALAQSLALRNVLVDLCLHTQRAMSTLEQRLQSIGRTPPMQRTESS